MRAMKDSGIEWIGEIPQEWKTARIKHVIDRSEFGIKIGPFGSTLANRTLISGPYNVYSQANLISNSFSDTNHHIDRDTFVDLRGYEVKPGDVCVSMMGTIGKCKVVPERITEGIMDSHLIKIRLDETQIDPGFFEYVYDKDNSGVCFTQMQYEKKGTIMDGLNTAIVKNLVIPLPSLTDQIDISKYLDTKCAEIDALIAAKEKTNTLLKEQRQSIIYEAVTKGLDPTVPMKDSGIEWIGEIPEGWRLDRLKYHALFNPQTVLPDFSDEDRVTFIPMESLKSGFHLHTVSNFGKVKKGYVFFAEKDILMAKVTPCLENGNLAIASNLINGVGFGSTEINVIRCYDIKIQYLFYLLQCPSYIEKATFNMFGVAGLKRLKPEFIPNSYFPIPSQEEQDRISDYLDRECGLIDKIISENESTMQKLKEYRQSLIYEAVTGKIEV